MTSILVVDDSELARASLSKMLGEAGFEVIQLPTAIGATRAIQQNKVALVVVDLNMPGLSGGSFVEVLRMHPRFRNLLIVVISGDDPEELERICTKCGADGALAKRDVREGLVPMVRRLLLRASVDRLSGAK
jgi:two-component system chemotaxis response regulator CheY